MKDVSNFRPISLINVGVKVLGKLLINRIMHYVYSNNLLNTNQYGFAPKKSTIDATLAVKEYIEEWFRQGHSYICKSRREGCIRRSMVAEYITHPKSIQLPEKPI